MWRAFSILRVLLKTLGIVLTVAVVLVVSARALLETEAGERWLRDFVVERVDEALPGRVEFDRIDIIGWSEARVEGVRLLGVDGEEVARLESAHGSIRLAPLLRRDIVVSSLDAAGVTADLVPDPDGELPLLRALRDEDEESTPGQESRFSVTVRDATVGLGQITWQSDPEEPPVFELDQGTVTGGIEYRNKRLSFDAQLQALLSTPGQGPASAQFSGVVDDGRLHLSRGQAVLPGGIVVDLATKDEESEGSDSTSGAASDPTSDEVSDEESRSDTETTSDPAVNPTSGTSLDSVTTASQRRLLDRVRIRLTLPADGLLPYNGPLLSGPIDIVALLRFQKERIHFNATATPDGPGEIGANGWFESGKPGVMNALVDARGIDPASLLPQLPDGEVWVAIEADGALAFPPNARSDFRMWLAPSQLSGASLGPGNARVEAREGIVSLSSLFLQLPGASLDGSGALKGNTPLRAEVDVDIENLERLSSVIRGLGISIPQVDGRGKARLKMAEGGERIQVDGRFPLLTIEGRAFLDTDLAARRTGSRWRLDARTETRRGTVVLAARGRLGTDSQGSPTPMLATDTVTISGLRLEVGRVNWTADKTATLQFRDELLMVRELSLIGPGNLHLDARVPTNPKSRAPLSIDFRLSRLDLANLAPLLPDEDPTGFVDVAVTVEGTRREPMVEASFGIEEAQAVDLPRMSASANARLTSEEATASGWVLAAGGALVRFEGNARADSGQSLLTASGREAAAVQARIEAPNIDLDALARAKLLPPTLGGQMEAAVEIDGTVARPEVSAEARLVELHVADLPFGELPPTQATLELNARGDEVLARLEADIRGAPPITASARVSRSLRSLIQQRDFENVPIEAAFTVDRGRIQTPQAGLVAEEAALTLRFSGTPSKPQATLVGDAEGLRALGKPVGRVDVNGALGEESWDLVLSLFPLLGGPLLVDLSGPAPGSGSRTPWRGAVEARLTRLDFLELIPRIRLMENAVLDGRLELAEDTFAPIFDGGLRLQARRVAVAGVGTVNNVEVALLGQGHTIGLEQLGLGASGGRLDTSGAFTFEETGWRFRLDTDANKFPIPTPLRPAGTATTSVALRLREVDREITGTVDLSRGEVEVEDALPDREFHSLTLPPDYVVHDGERAEPAKPSLWERWLAKRTARIRARVPRDFWVRGGVANADVTADTLVLWDGNQVTLDGAAEVTRGTVTIVRRRFDIAELALTFDRESPINPGIRARLLLDDRDLRVTLLATGRIRSPEIDLSSDPPMSAGELALLVAGGGGGGIDVGSGVAGTALSGALNYVAGQVGQALADFLPLDVLAFELGPSGQARQIEAGAYVTPDLFVSFVRNLFAQNNENTNEVQAEYRISRRISLRTRYGDRQAGGVDLLYQLSFRSRAQVRADKARRREGEDETPDPLEDIDGVGAGREGIEGQDAGEGVEALETVE